MIILVTEHKLTSKYLLSFYSYQKRKKLTTIIIFKNEAEKQISNVIIMYIHFKTN